MKIKFITKYSQNTFESLLIGKTASQVEDLLGDFPEKKSEEEYVYVLETCFFGLIKKRIYIFFSKKGIVRDFFIG